MPYENIFLLNINAIKSNKKTTVIFPNQLKIAK